jgi:methionyl-tRNA synthetase
MPKVLITSALPYANGPLHFGHIAGAYLPGDCYARFQRLQGADVLYLCGSDEHGVAITLSAEMAGRTPQEHVDLFHAVNLRLFQKLDFSFDHYSRTTWPGHVQTTQEFFQDLLAGGYIEERVTEQLYSESDRRFLADRYVLGSCPKCGFAEARGDECQSCGASYEATDLLHPRSKVSGAPLVLRPTKHWFLRFDLFTPQLTAWIRTKKWKSTVTHFAASYIEDLRPRAITRDSDWGIPVPLPQAEGKVFYVWFDAPIGYISAAREWAELRGTPDAWKAYWCDPETRLVQFIGKDNIPFHAVFFPAMIMGQSRPYKLVDELPANEFYTLEGRQFSKSEGWTIDLEAFFQKFSVDQIRYVIAANAPENQDAEFSWRDFQTRCNAELVGKYGNLANRILTFVAKQCAHHAPPSSPPDSLFLCAVRERAGAAAAEYASFHLRKASQIVMEIAQMGNAYFDAEKPWALAKDPARREELEAVLAACLECLKVLALVSYPIIPETAQRLWRLLGVERPLAAHRWEEVLETSLPPGRPLPPPEILFQKVEESAIDEEIAKLKGTSAPPARAPYGAG